ncbi:3-deoxy-manno-octulosonate cytidylyltransferase [Echinicola pacifica]|uniref:3-deoxy-manno-octulosonate cytidylyltransferase n=1 Tax=Echinicola pacifica TaxID=346377 RepID=A0A918PP34_9BACT|nr:3-deoxy-manno-octulosonate cytidylyltransferase [Echinicola pacifica]GGZ15568.1 3-deoxy-manno-octulosonate cytidylyltransferase [Echinicola pacifica]
MKIVAMIPARFGATRFPGKLTSDLCGKPVIVRTYLSTVATGLFDQVIVVTDHESIAEQIKKEGGEVFFSTKIHESGSDRIAEAIASIEADVVVNVQGDEPFQDKESLANLVQVFADPQVKVASMMRKIDDEVDVINPNSVKVVVDQNSFAMYFSRSPIPFVRDQYQPNYYRHIGVYAYKKDMLMEYTGWEKSMLEKAEMLEQLRLLEHGVRIKMVETTHEAVAIDTKLDLDRAIAFYQRHFL